MRISNDFLKENVGGECVLVPVGDAARKKNGVFTLNETGEKIFDLIKAGKTREETVSALYDEYGAEPSEIADYVDEFILKMREAGIVTDD